MASNLGNLAGTVSLDIDPFQQSARTLDRQMRTIDKTLRANEIAFKNNSKNINAQKANYNLTGKAVDVYSAQLEKQKEKYQSLINEVGDFSTATAQQKMDLLSAEGAIADTTAKLDNMVASHKNLGREIAIQESNWTKFGDGLDTYGKKLSNIGDGLNTFGNKMTMGVTVPIVAGVAAVAKAAIDWESAFAGTKKTVDEVVDANGKVIYSYDELEAGLRSLAKELPATHAEIAATAENAGQLGIATENVISFTKTMIDLGESTNLGAEEASVALARLANITQMPQENFERLGSTIVELGNNLATTESEITEMSLRLAGAGSQVGMSESQIVSFAAALSSVGIEAEAGKQNCPTVWKQAA